MPSPWVDQLGNHSFHRAAYSNTKRPHQQKKNHHPAANRGKATRFNHPPITQLSNCVSRETMKFIQHPHTWLASGSKEDQASWHTFSDSSPTDIDSFSQRRISLIVNRNVNVSRETSPPPQQPAKENNALQSPPVNNSPWSLFSSWENPSTPTGGRSERTCYLAWSSLLTETSHVWGRWISFHVSRETLH